MNRNILQILLYSIFIISIIIIGLSIGWMLIIFGIVLVPIAVIHVLAINKCKINVQLETWTWGSSILFLIFALLRPDFSDTGGVYTGLSVVKNLIGLSPVRDSEIDENNLGISLLFLLAVIVIDIITLVKAKRLKKSA